MLAVEEYSLKALLSALRNSFDTLPEGYFPPLGITRSPCLQLC